MNRTSIAHRFPVLAVACLATVIVWLTGAKPAGAQEGMRSIPSPHDVAGTIDRLVAALESKGMTVMARIDHAANATQAGLELPATQLLVFGNPKAGTALMQCGRSVAIDLPQKMLAWEDGDGNVRLGWNDPSYLKTRHGLDGCDQVLANVTAALDNFASAATAN